MRNVELTKMRDSYCMEFIHKSYKDNIPESTTCKELIAFYEPLFKDYEAVRNYYRSVLGKKGYPVRKESYKVPESISTIVDNYNQLVSVTRDYTTKILGGWVSSVSYTQNSTKTETNSNNNVLVIGDIHEPFSLEGYFEFCVDTYNRFNCNKVVFIGDILDNHYQSFHDTDPDGDSASQEFKKAYSNIQKWYSIFPEAVVCAGNHDLIPDRKAFKAGLSKSWIKPIGDVLNTPNWKFVDNVVIDNVTYTHGTGRKAKDRMKQDMVSVIQGHYHSESYIEYSVGINHKLFAMQLGCGIDKNSYAMAYGKNFAKPHINCGVVLDNGTLPLLIYMNL